MPPHITDIPLPAYAHELPIGAALSYQARIDVVLNNLQASLRPTFGVVQNTQYSVPATTQWSDVQRFYREAFPDLAPDAAFRPQTNCYQLLVLSSPDHKRFIAISLMDPPGADDASRTLLISMARQQERGP